MENFSLVEKLKAREDLKLVLTLSLRYGLG